MSPRSVSPTLVVGSNRSPSKERKTCFVGSTLYLDRNALTMVEMSVDFENNQPVKGKEICGSLTGLTTTLKSSIPFALQIIFT